MSAATIIDIAPKQPLRQGSLRQGSGQASPSEGDYKNRPYSPLRGEGSEELRRAVKEAIEQMGLSQSAAAREAGLSGTILSLWMRGQYGGDNARIETELRTWLEHRDQRQTAAPSLPELPGWLPTPTGSRIIAALSYAQMAGDLSLIYGGAGLGKSISLAHYQAAHPNVWALEASPACCTVSALQRRLAEALHLRLPAGPADLAEASLIERIRGSAGLIAVDEAQFLPLRALESLRRLHDLAGVGLALLGNEIIFAQLTGRSRAAAFAQLYSRVGKRTRLTRATRADATALSKAWDITEAAAWSYQEKLPAAPVACGG